MIDGIVRWVYCLPIQYAVVLALLATGGFFGLHLRYSSHRWWKPAIVTALVVWAVTVLAYTVLGREERNFTISLMPLQSYIDAYYGGNEEMLRSSFMNVLLFYPGGLLLLSLFPKWKWWLVVAGFMLASASIELSQYIFRLGFAEMDDVLHNTLGALLGTFAFRQFQKHNKTPKG